MILDLTDSGFDSISSFKEGLAYFSADGLYGYMDKSGEIVIDPLYGDAGYFYDGLAKVMKDGLFGLIGKDGREVLSPKYSDIRVEETSIIARKDKKVYCFDRNGEEIFSGAWDEMWESEDVYYIEKEDKKGLADKKGNIILEPDYMEVTKVPEEELIIVKDGSEKFAVMDYEGQVRMPFQYSYIKEEEGGLKIVEADTGKTGLLDKSDLSVKIPAVYDSLLDFTGERAVAELDEKYGIVRYDGTLEMPIEYSEIRLFSNGSILVCDAQKAELTDKEGNLILTGYGSIDEWGEGYTSNGRYWDSQGTLAAEDKFSWPDSVYGAENSHLLYEGSLLKSGEENEENTEKYLLTNQITPGAGPLFDYLKTGSVASYTGGPLSVADMDRMPPGRRFCKLYRLENQKNLMLYFYAVPWRRSNYQESESGLFTIKDEKAVQLVGASECGGSLRGDWTCFWYDTKENMLKPGSSGGWGGWGGYASGGDVYGLKKGEAVLETSFRFAWSSAADGGQIEEYTVNDEELSEEQYHKVEERFRYYLPIDNFLWW